MKRPSGYRAEKEMRGESAHANHGWPIGAVVTRNPWVQSICEIGWIALTTTSCASTPHLMDQSARVGAGTAVVQLQDLKTLLEWTDRQPVPDLPFNEFSASTNQKCVPTKPLIAVAALADRTLQQTNEKVTNLQFETISLTEGDFQDFRVQEVRCNQVLVSNPRFRIALKIDVRHSRIIAHFFRLNDLNQTSLQSCREQVAAGLNSWKSKSDAWHRQLTYFINHQQEEWNDDWFGPIGWAHCDLGARIPRASVGVLVHEVTHLNSSTEQQSGKCFLLSDEKPICLPKLSSVTVAVKISPEKSALDTYATHRRFILSTYVTSTDLGQLLDELNAYYAELSAALSLQNKNGNIEFMPLINSVILFTSLMESLTLLKQNSPDSYQLTKADLDRLHEFLLHAENNLYKVTRHLASLEINGQDVLGALLADLNRGIVMRSKLGI